ncbi:MAG: hypothetical protein ACRDRR_19075 [Pseudonocardiaceae bacterium]
MSPPEPPVQARASGVDSGPTTRVPEQPEPGAAAEPDVFEASALPQVLKIAGSVVAPATLLTALMYYFGRLQFAGFLWYLGAHVTVLDLTVQDYLNNSVDGLLPTLIVVAGITLLALWIHQLLLGALTAGTRRTVLRVLLPILAIAGLVLVSLAMVDFVWGSVFKEDFREGRGLSLSVGVLLLFYAVRVLRLLIAERRPEQLPRRAPGVIVAEWGAVFILVSVGLFWAVGGYAINAGIDRAHQFEASLASRSDVVAYSEKRLSLQAPGVREVTCQYPDAAYRFRYDGLKFVLQVGNQYLLLPAGWTRAQGAAILIARSEAVRLEFSPPGQVRDVTC